MGATTLPPEKRRRLVNSNGKTQTKKRTRAAVKLQRAWRKQRAIRNSLDPCTQEPVPRGPHRYLLVDSSNVAYKFHGPTLAALVLCSGCFRHPVLRRELLAPEVRRMARSAGLEEPERQVLQVCFELRQATSRYEETRTSLGSFLEGEAGAALGVVLDRAEIIGSQGILLTDDDGVLSYADAMDTLVLRLPHCVPDLVRQHQLLLQNRAQSWPEVREDLLDVMEDALEEASERMRKQARRHKTVARTAVGQWIEGTL